MRILKAYAVVSVNDLAVARRWYTRLFQREPDLTPMAEVHEWYFGQSGVQLLLDAKHAGSSMLTLIVENLDEVRSALQQANLQLGAASSSDFATTAQITDPDGNLVTFAQPGPAQRR